MYAFEIIQLLLPLLKRHKSAIRCATSPGTWYRWNQCDPYSFDPVLKTVVTIATICRFHLRLGPYRFASVEELHDIFLREACKDEKISRLIEKTGLPLRFIQSVLYNGCVPRLQTTCLLGQGFFDVGVVMERASFNSDTIHTSVFSCGAAANSS